VTLGAAIAGAFRSPFCNGGGKAHDPAYEGEVDTVYLGCWRPSVFERVGLFDPELVRNQDDEFHFRLRRSGGRIWQSPRIRSRYAPRRSLAGLFRQYVQYGFWKVAVIRKHRALASWRHLVPALFVGSLLLLAALFLLAWVLGWDVAAAIAAAALAVELGLYAIAGGAATLALARCLRPPALLVVPLAFAVYHFAYGAGFLMGLLSQGKSPAWGAALAKLFTALTR
jgi:hypothetical protein